MADVDDQSETIAFLSDPDSHGGSRPVERIDTHAAILFLAGDHVFKLKRAVRYPYLDFSTLERRRAVCEAELALNRRTAPDLYREVRAVNRQADGTLGFGPGDPVDWLVVMRRFAADDLLADMAERGALDGPLCRRLADRIAAFHDTAQVALRTDGAVRIGRIIDGNRESMARLPEDALSQADCARLHATSRRALVEIAPLLDRRGREGHVRHGHGDLHLANICLWQGEPTLFDCLEFDAELATIDVLYDLAFLLMDLWQRGQREQASWIFNRYLDLRDEGDGLATLPLFLSLRAGVRAHVEALRDETRDAGRDYLAAALDFLAPSHPRLIAIGGFSGTGKSTLARALAPLSGGAPGARVLRSDVLRKRLAGIAPEARLPDSAYTPAANRAVYDRLMTGAAIALAAGRSVIADGVFAAPDARTRIGDVARRCGVPFAGFWLEAPRDRLLARVGTRRDDASDAGPAVVERQLGRDPGDLAPWHRIDASGTTAETLAGLCARLDEGAMT